MKQILILHILMMIVTTPLQLPTNNIENFLTQSHNQVIGSGGSLALT